MLLISKNIFVNAGCGFSMWVLVIFCSIYPLRIPSSSNIRPSKIASHAGDLWCHLTQKIWKSILAVWKRRQLLLRKIFTVGLPTTKIAVMKNRCLSTYCNTFPFFTLFSFKLYTVHLVSFRPNFDVVSWIFFINSTEKRPHRRL